MAACPGRARPAWGLPALALVLVGLACGGARGNAEPNPPPPLDLDGRRIMLIPARPGAPAELDRELAFWLTDAAPATDWILPEQIERTVASNPASRFDLDGPRTLKNMGGENYRIADPLYGDIRRLGAILDAGTAFIPLRFATRTDSLGMTVELTAVVVLIQGGQVLWRHTVREGPVDDEAHGAAESAAALARTLIRESG